MPYRVSDQGIAVVGFKELQAALQRIGGGKSDYGLEYELQRRLRVVGETVAKSAPGFVTHRTGRHGNAGEPPLEDSVKVSVTMGSASVYSTDAYGGAQNVGAGPKAGWQARGPHIQRGKASGWMNQAVSSQRGFVEAELMGLLDWLRLEFERG
jgi:hypothetical protein